MRLRLARKLKMCLKRRCWLHFDWQFCRENWKSWINESFSGDPYIPDSIIPFLENSHSIRSCSRDARQCTNLDFAHSQVLMLVIRLANDQYTNSYIIGWFISLKNRHVLLLIHFACYNRLSTAQYVLRRTDKNCKKHPMAKSMWPLHVLNNPLVLQLKTSSLIEFQLLKIHKYLFSIANKVFATLMEEWSLASMRLRLARKVKMCLKRRCWLRFDWQFRLSLSLWGQCFDFP